jgi:hypothetical protein
MKRANLDFQRLLTFPCIGLPLYLFANLPYCSTEKRSAGTCRSPWLLTHKAEATAVQADPTINRANREASPCGALVDAVLAIGRERQQIMEAMQDGR